MKHAKKMVVISEDEYKKLKGCKKSKQFIKAANYKQCLGRKLRKINNKPLIEGYFIPDHQLRVKNLLKELESTGFKVHNNREIELPHGDRISGSDILDLMKELFTGSRLSAYKPVGWNEFINVVASSTVPLSIFTKAQARNAIRRVKQEEDILEDDPNQERAAAWISI